MINKLYSAILMLVAFVLFGSCKESTRSEINELLSVPIHLTVESFERIDGKIQTRPFVIRDYKFIVFADSSECMSCSIEKLDKWNSFSDSIVSNYNISFMYVLSPVQNEYDRVRNNIQHKRLSFPVFLDKNNMFSKNNKAIPSSSLYHVFIIDKNGKIVYFGDPRSNEKLNGILFKSIENIRNNEFQREE